MRDQQSLRLWLVLVCALAAPAARADLLVSAFNGNSVLRYSETNGASLGTFIAAGSGGLNLPHGLATGPDGNLYVASAGNDSVLRYNPTNGAFIDAFVPSGSGGLDYPVTLIFRPDGLLYVSSQLNDRVLRFHAITGAFVDEFVTNASGGLDGPSGMAFAPDGNLVVVGRFGNHALRYRGSDGAFLDAFVPAGGGGLDQPFGCAFGPDGDLFVVSGNSNKVARFHGTTGASLGDFVATGAGTLGLPIGCAFGPDGSFYVASFNNDKLARYQGATGAFVNNFVAGGSGGLDGPNFFLFRPARSPATNITGIGPIGPVEQRHLGFLFTEGPAADANGHVFFTDVQSNRIYRTDAVSGLLSTYLTNSRACNGLMFDQSGRLIACQRDERRIIAFDVPTTNITVVASNFGAQPLVGPNDLVVDGAGGVYFSDPNFGTGQTGATQAVYYAASNGAVSKILTNIARPNGVLLSTDESKLYLLSSVVAELLTFPILAPGVIGAPVSTALPVTGDGLTIDTAGNLYLTQPGRSNVLVLSPAGVTLGVIPFPQSPANCVFGGKDMKTLFVTARTSLYTCRMEVTGHRFAWNPFSYAAFQTKFFAATNAPGSAPSDDPDGDGNDNALEYLTRTHPLCGTDAWKLAIQSGVSGPQLVFPQTAGRGFEVLANSGTLPINGWQTLAVPGNPLPVSPTNRTVTITDDSVMTNRAYRVRIYQP
jgi:gluconolactonase